MRTYILSRPKGTFSDKVLQACVKKEIITEDEYKQLTETENTESTANQD